MKSTEKDEPVSLNAVELEDDISSVGGSQQLSSNRITYEEALQACGGLGRFQIYSTTTLILGFLSGSYIVYAIPFLTVYPDYECFDHSGQWHSCDRVRDICEPELGKKMWRIDYSSPRSYRNWVDPDALDLTCADKSVLGSFGSIYFIGFAISSGIVPYLSDKMGRKTPYILSILIQTLAFIIMIMSTSVSLTQFTFLVVGLCSGGRVATGTNYMNEFIPSDKQTFITTCLNCGDATVMIVQSILYFFFRSAVTVQTIGLVMAIMVLLLLVRLPESPKFLYAKKNFMMARWSLKQIQDLNATTFVPILTTVFDTEDEIKQEKLETESGENSSRLSTGPQQPDGENVIALTGSQKELCQIWQLRRNMICLMVILTACSFCFYLINFEMKYIEGSLVRNTITSQTSEFVADIAGSIIYLRYGPRIGFSVMFIVTIVGSTLLVFFQSIDSLIPLFVTLAKFGVSASFNIVYIAAVRLIPTQFAATVFGYSNLSARLVTMTSSMIAEVPMPAPLIICMMVSAVATVASLFVVTKMPRFV